MKKIFLAILIILSLSINVYGQTNLQIKPTTAGQDMQYNLYDIENKKICQIIMSDDLFWGFVNNPEKDYLDNIYQNNYGDVIEYSLDEKNIITAIMINKNHDYDYINSSSECIDIYGTFSDGITCDVMIQLKELLTDYLSEQNINSEILGGCILSIDYQLYPRPILYLFTESNKYFICIDEYHNINLYNAEEFKNKFSIKWEWGKFISDNEDINDIKPIYIIDASYVSIRDFLEYMGCDVGWNEENREFTFKYKGKEYQCKDNILSFIYNINTGEQFFEITWTSAFSGLNLNGKLYYGVDEVNLFAQKVFNRKLSTDYNDRIVYCSPL